MAIIVRLDIDRAYGRQPFARHCLSRLASDLYFPKISQFGYLKELETMLEMLGRAGARSYVFFRRCTLPSRRVMDLMKEGRHVFGLHLENSRSAETFREEVASLEKFTGQRIRAVSKHGSGGAKYGFHHYAPYEPERYVAWAGEQDMELFLGNLEDPTLDPYRTDGGLQVFPSAFWLEPHWRDMSRYSVDWLMENGKTKDIVLLVHPENVLADPVLLEQFQLLITTLETRIF